MDEEKEITPEQAREIMETARNAIASRMLEAGKAEADAIQIILTNLLPLPADGQKRVIQYLASIMSMHLEAELTAANQLRHYLTVIISEGIAKAKQLRQEETS